MLFRSDEFLEKTGFGDLGDRFIDGTKVADILDVKLETIIPRGTLPPFKKNKRFADLV